MVGGYHLKNRTNVIYIYIYQILQCWCSIEWTVYVQQSLNPLLWFEMIVLIISYYKCFTCLHFRFLYSKEYLDSTSPIMCLHSLPIVIPELCGIQVERLNQLELFLGQKIIGCSASITHPDVHTKTHLHSLIHIYTQRTTSRSRFARTKALETVIELCTQMGGCYAG